jgi:hypothetical protein
MPANGVALISAISCPMRFAMRTSTVSHQTRVRLQPQCACKHSEQNEATNDVAVFGDMGEQLTHCKVICVWVAWGITPVFWRGRLYDSHHHLLETWSADPTEDAPGILLTAVGRHGLNQRSEFINRAIYQPVDPPAQLPAVIPSSRNRGIRGARCIRCYPVGRPSTCGPFGARYRAVAGCPGEWPDAPICMRNAR